MDKVIITENINDILYFMKHICINLGAFYIGMRVINKNIIKNKIVIYFLIIMLLTGMEVWVIKNAGFTCGVMILILFTAIFTRITKADLVKQNVSVYVLSLGISNIILFVSAIISGIFMMLFNITNDYISFGFIFMLYWAMILYTTNIRKLRNGLTFFTKKFQNEFFDILMLNLGAIILVVITILKNSDLTMKMEITFALAVLSIIMFITIQKSFQVYYKQKLLIQELDETKSELKSKTDEVQKLEQENLNFSKKSHSLAHKQESLEYKLNQVLLKSEIANEIGLTQELQEISKELYKKPTMELDKTGITKIDDMLNFMQSECIKNDIDFDLQLSGNIYYIINNIVTVEELEILLADHIKDAIIAIKHTDNINKSILVKLGKIDNTYGLYIYDSGIEFEKETLENLGKKPSTTHSDEGGTGMGFMNTFDTLKRCKGSLIINEIGKPSKDNYTKIVMIKFDGKDEFKIISYRN